MFSSFRVFFLSLAGCSCLQFPLLFSHRCEYGSPTLESWKLCSLCSLRSPLYQLSAPFSTTSESSSTSFCWYYYCCCRSVFAITTSNSLSLNACVCFGISRRFGGGSFLPNERRGSFLSFYSSFSTSFWSFSSPFANGISTYSSSSSSCNDFSQSAKPTLTYFKLCGEGHHRCSRLFWCRRDQEDIGTGRRTDRRTDSKTANEPLSAAPGR